MKLTVLAVPGCPHAAVLEQRLAALFPVRSRPAVTRQVITDADQAARYGMHGSPTLLIDGRDPFSGPGEPATLACRLYPGEDGRLDGAPTVAALRQALADASLLGP